MRSTISPFFLFLLFFLPAISFSGNGDSLLQKKNIITQFFSENQFEFPDSAAEINNSLVDFQNYIQRNHLGNSGLAYNEPYSEKLNNGDGFNYCKNNFQNYFYSRQNLKFYNTRSPHTDLLYIVGSKKEQDFKMTFSYNIKKNWNITADF